MQSRVSHRRNAKKHVVIIDVNSILIILNNVNSGAKLSGSVRDFCELKCGVDLFNDSGDDLGYASEKI